MDNSDRETVVVVSAQQALEPRVGSSRSLSSVCVVVDEYLRHECMSVWVMEVWIHVVSTYWSVWTCGDFKTEVRVLLVQEILEELFGGVALE